MRLRARHRVTGMTGRPGWLAHALAALDMDFAGGRYFGKQLGDLTVTRASAGYAQDQAGSWQNFAANAPRRTDRGLLVEMARTNVLRNNSMQGASAAVLPTFWAGNLNAASGMVSSSFSAPVTDGGIDCINVSVQTAAHSATASVLSFDGQATGNGLVPVTGGSVWTGSVFLKLLSGSLTTGLAGFDLAVREYNSSGTFLSQTLSSIQGVGAAMSRQTMTVTTGGTTAYITLALRINYSAGGSAAFSLRVGWPQLEAGAYATSPIRTTSAAQTRAADVIYLPLSGFPAAHTSLSKVTPTATTGGDQGILEIGDGTANNRVLTRKLGAAIRRAIISGGTNLVAITEGTGWALATRKIAYAISAGSQQLAADGVLQTADAAATIPPAAPRAYLGSLAGGSAGFFEGYIERIAIIPSRISNTELQQVTA